MKVPLQIPAEGLGGEMVTEDALLYKQKSRDIAQIGSQLLHLFKVTHDYLSVQRWQRHLIIGM
jgi:hypothetical protein